MIRVLVLFTMLAGVLAAPTRIVNGTDAEDGEFPFIVSLQWKGLHNCGATILNDNWVLTAAHCVDKQNISSLSIWYGSNVVPTREIQTEPSEGGRIAVANYIVYEKYIHVNEPYDIAVIQLASRIPLNKKAAPVNLPKQLQVTPNGSPATLIGWGRNETYGSSPASLQKVNISVVDWETCNEIHGGEVYEGNICAGVPEGGRGQCSGDSGGPLVVNGTQVGIVSWSEKPCTLAPYPGVFTDVGHYRDWIREKTGV